MPKIVLAVLVGNRASGSATEQSDWDIAGQWPYRDPLNRIAAHKRLCNRLARELGVSDNKIDLIDLSSARLAMKILLPRNSSFWSPMAKWHRQSFSPELREDLKISIGNAAIRLEIGQAETARVAYGRRVMLDEARSKRSAGQTLSALEQNGVLHALHELAENAIAKAKHLLKLKGEPMPVSAY